MLDTQITALAAGLDAYASRGVPGRTSLDVAGGCRCSLIGAPVGTNRLTVRVHSPAAKVNQLDVCATSVPAVREMRQAIEKLRREALVNPDTTMSAVIDRFTTEQLTRHALRLAMRPRRDAH